MMRLVSAVGAFALMAAASADAPPSALPVDLLVSQLGSDSYSERESATTALEAAGPAAIPALEAATRDPNPEVARRANQALAKLQRESDGKGRLDAKPVRLAYKSVPLGTAVNDLKARTGINLMLDPVLVADPLRLVTCETDDLPAWEAVAAFCKAAGLKEVFASELDAPKQEKQRRGYYTPPPPPPAPEAVPVSLVDGQYQSLPGSRNTAVRVLALPAEFPGHRVFLGSGDLVLNFDVAPMPGINWRHVAAIRLTTVIDDAGRRGGSGTVRTPDPSYGGDDFLMGGGAMWMRGGMALRWDGDMPMNPTTYPNPRIVPVPIKVATPGARSLKLLEGTVVCEVAVLGQALVTIDDVVRSTGQGIEGFGGTKVTVLETHAAAKGKAAILKVQTESLAPWAASRRFINPWGNPMFGEPPQQGVANQLKAFDVAGKAIRINATSTSEFSNDEFLIQTVTQFNCPDGIPVKLVLIGPKPVLIEVPFKMENVPLP